MLGRKIFFKKSITEVNPTKIVLKVAQMFAKLVLKKSGKGSMEVISFAE